MKSRNISYLAWLGCWLAFSAHALSSDSTQPLYIEADKASFNHFSGVNTFEGHVIITQGSSRLFADQVILYTDKKHHLQHLTATGQPSRYETQVETEPHTLVATATNIQYHVAENQLELIGQVHAEQGKDKIEGPMLIYNTKEKLLSAPSNQTTSERTVIVFDSRK
ncbi:MAG: lipopolysaccharide transport periplasmic protein LptA [Gammaproteobacteria bacterium]|nr:lipopolysaccharide transport periplasmic protein LptA [Gammaproteobacteria bacterium]